jgi:hypothetical protein
MDAGGTVIVAVNVGLALGIRLPGSRLLVLPAALLLHPRARAAVRLAPGFRSLEADARVFYEPGAEAPARRFAEALPAAIVRVEESHGAPFRSRFRVYVCASHASFTRRLAERPDSPVRGMRLVRDVWLSPLAFDFRGSDTHRQTLTHELSHLHMTQQLGLHSILGTVPTWFAEGLADRVADTGGEIVSRQDALEAFASGNHLVPDARGRLLLPRTARHYGISWPMLHRQSRMFVEYLHDRAGGTFTDFVATVGSGERFDRAFRKHYGESLDGVWRDFLRSLERDSATPTGGPRRWRTARHTRRRALTPAGER